MSDAAENENDSKPVEEKKEDPPMTPVLLVAVGSTNPVKVNAVREAIQQVIQTTSQSDIEVDVQGFSVPSKVPDQPMGDDETQLGAKNRAEAAHNKFRELHGKFPHLSVGLEGGLEWSESILDTNEDKTLWCMAWMAIYGRRTTLLAETLASKDSEFYSADKKPIFALSKTGTFLLPASLTNCIVEGMELGDADDKVFGRVNSKQKSGTVGILTDGIINRTEYYKHALVMALIPWIRPDVYSSPQPPPSNESEKNENGASRSFVSSLFCTPRKK